MPRRVLVVRNDKLGDFVLALPTCELLARQLPDARIAVLVPEYTREVAELVPYIHEVLIDPGTDSPTGSPRALAALIRAQGFDAAITLFSTVRVGFALFLARVSSRYAPATKLGQWFYTSRVSQRRSQSIKPEYEYNLDLARRLLDDCGVQGEFELKRPVLPRDTHAERRRRAELDAEHGLDSDEKLIALHSGHGGSANNLDVGQYAALASQLRSARGHAFLCTAGPGEVEAATELANKITGARAVVHASKGGLAAFVQTLAACDMFIGGSTGPLHLAGALDLPTVSFYPRRRTSSPLRWQALNAPERRFAYAPPEPWHERDLSGIDLSAVASEVSARLLGAT